MFFSPYPIAMSKLSRVPEVPEEEELADILDKLVYELWKEEDRDKWEEVLRDGTKVHVSEITYLEPRTKTLEPSMLHGLECELGLKARIDQKYGNRVTDPRKPVLLYPPFPLVRVLQFESVGRVYLIGNPDFILYYPLPSGYTLIPVEKKSGSNNTEDWSKKVKVAKEQGVVYALMLGTKYFAVQLHRNKMKAGKLYTVTHDVYKITDVEGAMREVLNRAECIAKKKQEGSTDYDKCKTKELSEFIELLTFSVF